MRSRAHTSTRATSARLFASSMHRGSCKSSSLSSVLTTSYSGGVRGRPNSGNRRSVSRNAVNPTIRPSEISRTCSAHGSCLPPGPLGRYCRHEPWALQVLEISDGRHRLLRVLVQQRRERVHVVLLERLHVPLQQLLLLLVERLERLAEIGRAS